MAEFRRSATWHGLANCSECARRGEDLLADLQPADFARLRLPIDRLTIEPDYALYKEGEAGHALYSLRSGLIKLVRYAPRGEARIVRLAMAGDVVGMEVLLGKAYDHTAIALDCTQVCRIPSEVITSMATQSPGLNQQLMRRWQQSLSRAEDWLTLLSTGRAQTRVARLLLSLCDGRAEPVCCLLPREDIAAIVGITTETASRVIADLRRRKIIVPLSEGRLMAVRTALEEIAAN